MNQKSEPFLSEAARLGNTDGAPVTSDSERLVEELRQIIGLRSRRTLRERPFPVLFALLSEADRATTDARFVALTRILDEAVASIDDPAHRHAAGALVGSGPGRWRTVAQRGADAASTFGCGWDAYRRKRASGTSQLDDTLDALASALRAGSTTAPSSPDRSSRASGADPPTEPSRVLLGRSGDGSSRGTATDLTPPPTETGAEHRNRSSRRDGLTVALVVLALMVGASVAWALTRPDPPAPVASGPADQRPESCARLTHSVGDLSPAADQELRRWAPTFRAAAPDLPDGSDTCAGLLGRESGLVLQPISDGTDQGVGALVAVDGEPPSTVTLYHSEYWVYRIHVDAFGSAIGVPLGRADRPDGARVLKLSQGAIVGGPHEKSRIVSGVFFATWTQRGGADGDMGLPVSAQRDVTGTGKVQDFQTGRLIVDYLDPTAITWEAAANPGGLLPTDINDRVLVGDDGSSWWVDSGGTRHWIPTSSDFACASSLGANVESQVPIIAIATLEIGEPFRCR